MDFTERIAEQVAKVPPALKPLLERELAAGNMLKDVEIGRGEHAGKVALVLKRRFHTSPSSVPAGVKYRESERKFGRIFEFVTKDDSFSLLTVEFKEIPLQKITGPTNVTEEQIARPKPPAREAERQKQLETERAVGPILTKFRKQHPDCSAAAQKFLASMQLDFDMWHDGEGYDLDALEKIPESECEAIESLLIHHKPRDWRDIEALGLFDSPTARRAVQAALKHSDPKVRREAMQQVPEKVSPAKRAALLIHALKTKGLYSGLSEALDEVEEFHPAKVIQTLLRGALARDGEAAVHFAAMLYFLHGKAKEPFDWDYRPFFLKFHTTDRVEREAIFRELCATIRVDAKKYLRSKRGRS
jgi:hypothetical protein